MALTRKLLTAGAVLAVLSASPALAQETVFLSTQLRPIEEAQKMRDVILKGFSGKVNFIPEDTGPFLTRLRAEAQTKKISVGVVGSIHGDLPVLVDEGIFDTVDDVLADLKVDPAFVALAKFGKQNAYYVPWMQASYIMVVNKKALQYLPAGADPAKLSYAQLAEWGANIKKATGERKIGFPAGPRGLMHRITQGYFYPSFTGGLVTPFRSDEAKAMWGTVKAMWSDSVNPRSTTYNFMQEPLLADEVWIGLDHTARLLDALNQKPDDFLALPAPSGPKGKGHMPVISGLAIPKGTPDRAGAVALIKHLTSPATQVVTLKEVGFYPIADVPMPADVAAGTKAAAAAIAAQAKSADALASLLPQGLGSEGGAFNKVFSDTFQRIILRNEDIAKALDAGAEDLKAIFAKTSAPCWAPDKPSAGACPVN